MVWTEGDNKAALSYQQEAAKICQQLELRDVVAVQALHSLAEAQSFSGKPRQAIENY